MPKYRKYFTLAVLPKEDGARWSPQFGDYDHAVVAQELEDTKKDWPRGSKFRIVRTDKDTKIAIDAEIDRLNREFEND